MRLSAVRSIVVTVIVLLCAAEARAQDSGGTPNQPPPGSGTPNQPPPGSGTPNQPPPAGTPSATPPQAAAPPPGAAPQVIGAPSGTAPPAKGNGEETEPKDEGRVRVGFNLNGGIFSGTDYSGVTLGATLRIGWQLNHLMGIYGQVSPLAGFGARAGGSSASVSALGGFQFTPLFSLTPIDLIELAAGPSLDKLGGGSTGAGVQPAAGSASVSASAFSGFYFGLHGRAALHIGGKPNTSTGRRTSFTIGFDVHPTFADGGAITLYTLGLGADWY